MILENNKNKIKMIRDSKYKNYLLSPFKWGIHGMLVVYYFLLKEVKKFNKEQITLWIIKKKFK
jgi:hypothetical protein